MRRMITTAVVSLLLLAAVGVSSASAETPSPWWHLSSASRPAYLQPGTAKQQVWQLTVSATAGSFFLQPRPYNIPAELSTAFYVGESPAEVQASFLAQFREWNYLPPGAGIEVTAKPGPYNQYETYEIKLTGEIADSHYFEDLLVEGSVSGGPGTVELKQIAEGRADGVIVVTAVNLGDENANPAIQPVTITDKLPPGLEAVGIEGAVDENFLQAGTQRARLECSLKELSCTFTGKPGNLVPPQKLETYPPLVPPYEAIQVKIRVNTTGAKTGAVNEARVTGGGAPAATASEALTVNDSPVPFGASTYEMTPEAAGGGADTQAGSHPFQLTTTIGLNSATEGAKPAALAKDLYFDLPPGLIGNPTPFPTCKLADFLIEKCPLDTVVGVARPTINLGLAAYTGYGGRIQTTFHAALYNLEPAVGEPARFGFIIEREPVLLNTAVRTGGDYGVTVTVRNITQAIEFLSSEVTFWGVPGDERHNDARGEECLEHLKQVGRGHPNRGECPGFSESNPPPLLSMPTSCTGPLHTTVQGDSWAEPQHLYEPLASTVAMAAMDGCDRLQFVPEIKVSPDSQQASKPTGLTVDVHVPQEGQLNPEGLAQSNVKNIVVTLPDGVTLNPSAADGLSSCSEAQIGYGGSKELEPVSQPGVKTLTFTPKVPGSIGASEPLDPGVNFCPNASKIAEASITTPLLPKGDPVKGFVYLASPQNFNVFPQENPFSKHVAMYIVAEDPVSGSLVKLPGRVELGGEEGVEGLAPGQIRATFEDNPQLAFEDAELHFFGGERAPLASPNHCGTYTTNATFTPWSGGEAVNSQSSFQITSGPNGAPCPGAALPFKATLASGTTNNNAGSYTSLDTTMSREDGQQSIQSVTLHYPAGVSGLLSGVKLCGEAEANAGTCGPESQIGETIVSVGVGGDPFTVTGGKAYITGPYEGAPFGLSITNPAKAGPFDLQQGRPVVVRAKIEVNPITAALTITTDPSGAHAIPTIIEGFPLQIQHVNVLVNRPGFTFNPTNCTPTAVTGQINSAEGASSPVSVPFQVTNCAVLKFAPKFAVSTAGKTSRANGASLTVKLAYPKAPFGSQANIKSVKVDLPKQLPSRLTTLQKACTAAQFEANPAGCPSASIVGHATAITPLIPVPLIGPAYFVSYGGAKFPELVIVLQGYGVTLDLHGETFISKAGITSSTFKTVPDAPVGSFELTLPEGKYSALAANGNLCKSKLAMPTSFVAQNGAVIKQSTPIGVTGCAKTKTLTRAQKLARALNACHKKPKSKRPACQKQAHKKYPPAKKKKK
jgi:hypothetical protein